MYTEKPSHTNALPSRRSYTQMPLGSFTHRLFYTQAPLLTNVFTHRCLYTPDAFAQRYLCTAFLHTDTFTHRCPYAKTLLHTDAFTQTRLHTDSFTHRHFYTPTLLRTDAFTQRPSKTLFTHKRLYTQTFCHTDAFTHRRLPPRMLNRNFISIFDDRPLFRAKGLHFVVPRWHRPPP